MQKKIKTPFVSIVIVNYNRKDWIENCLKQLKKINYPKKKHEVIVVDNNSSDSSRFLIRKKFSWVKLVELEKNYGAAIGKNIGIENSNGDYVYFLDSDVEIDSNSLFELVEFCEKNDDIGICGSRVMNMGTNQIQNAGDFISFFGILKHRGMNEEDKNQFNETQDVFSLPSCSMLVSKKLIDKMDFWFDPDFFIYFEDTEFCWRARLLGFRVVYLPKSIIYHRFKKHGDVDPKSIYQTYRNRIWSFRRNFRTPLKQLFLLNILLSTVVGISMWSLKGKWGFGSVIFNHLFDDVRKVDLSRISLKKQIKALGSKLF